jgi:hypothetical protein
MSWLFVPFDLKVTVTDKFGETPLKNKRNLNSQGYDGICESFIKNNK